MDRFIGTVKWLSQAFGILAAALLVIAAIVVCYMVFIRYALGASAVWQHEFVTYSVIGATFLGAPYVLLTRGHVNLDLLPLYLGARGRFALALIAYLTSLAFCLVIAWTGIIWWQEAYASGETGATVWKPRLWIPYLAMPFGMGMLSLQYLADILALVTGREAPFGLPEGRPQ